MMGDGCFVNPGFRTGATFLRRQHGVSLGALAVSAALLGTSPPALAQGTTPIVPTREEIQRTDTVVTPPAAEQIVAADDMVERAPCPLANPEFSNIRFTLHSVEFSAPEGIDPAALSSSWADRTGQELPIAEICDIRDRAATLLRARGYLAAVRVPPQRIEDGVVRLDILAARVSRIEVRGDAGRSEKLLQRYLSRLDDDPVFNIVAAERYLLLARDIPGIDARLTLRPSAVAGEVVGEVTIQRTPLYLDANIQNFGSRDVGRWGGIARARVTGLTGMGDMTTLSIFSTAELKEQQVVQAAHEFRVGGEGLRLGGSYTYAWTAPDVTGLDIKSRTQIISLFATYPLILTQSRRVTLGGGFDIIDQNIRFGGIPLNRDRLRVASVRADAMIIDPNSIGGHNGFSPAEPRWMFGGSLEARKGIAGLGASKDCGPTGAACFLPGAVPLTRIEGQPDAFLLRANTQFEWRPAKGYALSVAPRAQWASDPLLAYEEFSAGNFTVGRGYDPGTIIGDSGVAIAAEFKFDTLLPRDRESFAIQPFVFFDAARVWNKDSAFNGLPPQRLYSAGGGVRVAYGDLGRFDVSVAAPLNRPFLAAQRPDPRILISFTTQFGVRAR